MIVGTEENVKKKVTQARHFLDKLHKLNLKSIKCQKHKMHPLEQTKNFQLLSSLKQLEAQAFDQFRHSFTFKSSYYLRLYQKH